MDAPSPAPHSVPNACKPTQTSLSPNAESFFYLNQRGFVRFGRVGWSTLLQNKSFASPRAPSPPGSNAGNTTDERGGLEKSESLGVAGNRSSHPTFLSALQEQLDAVADFLCSEAQRRPPFGRHKETGKGPREEEEAREYVDRAREFCECLTG